MYKFNREKFCEDFQCTVCGEAESIVLNSIIKEAWVVKDILNNENFSENPDPLFDKYYEKVCDTLDDFINGKMRVYCRTKEEAIEFLNILELCGCKTLRKTFDELREAAEDEAFFGCFKKTVYYEYKEYKKSVYYTTFDSLILPIEFELMAMDRKTFNFYFNTIISFGGNLTSVKINSKGINETNEDWINKGYNIDIIDNNLRHCDACEVSEKAIDSMIDVIKRKAREHLAKRYENV